MKRDAFFERLNDTLDRREKPEQDHALQAAAAENAEYEQLLASQQRLFRGLKTLKPKTPDLSDRILAQMETPAEVAPQTSVPRSAWLSVLAVAAVALLAVGLMWSNGTGPDVVVKQPMEAETPDETPEQPTEGKLVQQDQPDVPANPAEKPLPELMQEMRKRYYALAEETTNSFSEVALLLPSPQPEPMNDSEEWIPNVGRQIGPLTSPVGNAFDYLLNALPADDQG